MRQVQQLPQYKLHSLHQLRQINFNREKHHCKTGLHQVHGLQTMHSAVHSGQICGKRLHTLSR